MLFYSKLNIICLLLILNLPKLGLNGPLVLYNIAFSNSSNSDSVIKFNERIFNS